MSALAGLDPGAGGWIGAGATAAIIAVVALGAAGAARIWGRGRAAWRHDLYLAALALILISPAIVYGVARSGAVLVALPRQAIGPAEAAPIPPPAPISKELVAQAVLPLSAPVASPPEDDGAMFVAPAPAPVVVEGPALVPDRAMPAPIEPGPVPAAVIAADPPAPAAPAIGREEIAGGLVATWLAGMGILAARLAYGLGRLVSLRRRCRPIDDPAIAGVLGDVRAALGAEALPPILIAERAGPAALGGIRPAVVLPEGLVEGIDRAELRDILIHECAHALRRDPLIGFFQRLAALIFWPHPLVHWLNRRLSMAREDVCDDYVLRGGDACGYARTLLSMALKAGPADRGMAAAVGFIGSRSRLERRIAGILSEGREPMTRGNRRLTAAAGAFLAAASIALAGVRPAGTDATTEQAAGEPAPQAAAGPKTIIRGAVVDEAGAPVAGASVNVTWFRKAPEDVRTGADGGFVLEIGGPIRSGELVRATDDRGRIGIANYREPIFSEASPIRIVMKSPRELVASVIDVAGAPVAGADVEILTYGDGPLDRAETDAGGVARFRYPADGRVRAVVALKDGVGMDYFENYDSWPADELGPLPGEIELKLEGARTIQVKAEGSQGEGVPGIVLYQLSMKKTGKIARVNLAGSTSAKEETDAEGIARFRWVPATVEGGQGVEVDPWKYHAAKPVVVANGEEVMNVLGVRRNARVTGRVSDPDGRPVAGVLLQADGVGSAFRPGSGLAKTDDQGRFALDLPPNQIYSIMLLDRERAIAPFTGLVVREGEPRDGLDLRLVEPSRVRGHIIPIPKDPEAVGQSIRILFRGPKVPAEFNEEYGSEKLEYVMARAPADAQGNFQAALGPGKYQISTSGFEWEREIEIKKPGEDAFFDVQQGKEVEAPRADDRRRSGKDAVAAGTARLPANARPQAGGRTEISGIVVDATGAAYRPVAGARIRGADLRGGFRTSNTSNAGFSLTIHPSPPEDPTKGEAVADPDGRFRMPKGGDTATLYVRSADGNLAGFARTPSRDGEFGLPIGPAATASGRLVDTKGKPLANHPISFGMQDDLALNPSTQFAVQELIRTDAKGCYRVTGLVPGMHCKFTTMRPAGSGGNWPPVASSWAAVVHGPSEIKLGDMILPADDAGVTRRPIVDPKGLDLSKFPPAPFLDVRGEAEAFIRAIGREPMTQELVDRIAPALRPRATEGIGWARAKQLAGDPRFLGRLDAAAREVSGKPADTLAIVVAAQSYQVGCSDDILKQFLRRAMAPGDAGVVSGSVVDASTGKPIRGAVVSNASKLTRTDDAGAFSLGGAPGGFWVEAEGYAIAAARNPRAGEPVRLALEPEAPILGRVVDREGRPVEGAEVRAFVNEEMFLASRPADSRRTSLVTLAARSDAQGWFAFRGMPAGMELRSYEVRHPRHLRCNASTASGGAFPLIASSPIALTMTPGAVVSGVVVGESGRAIPGARIFVETMGSGSAIEKVEERLTDGEGRFQLEDVPPGRWSMLVEPEPGDGAAKLVSVVADPRRPAAVQVVVESGGVVAGKVVDSDGKPIAGAMVGQLAPLDPTGVPDEKYFLAPSTRTDAAGIFRIGPIPSNGARLTVSAIEPRKSESVIARANQFDLVITVRPDPR